MTRPSKRELENVVDDIEGDDAADEPLAAGFTVTFGNEESPAGEADIQGDGWAIYYDADPTS